MHPSKCAGTVDRRSPRFRHRQQALLVQCLLILIQYLVGDRLAVTFALRLPGLAVWQWKPAGHGCRGRPNHHLILFLLLNCLARIRTWFCSSPG